MTGRAWNRLSPDHSDVAVSRSRAWLLLTFVEALESEEEMRSSDDFPWLGRQKRLIWTFAV